MKARGSYESVSEGDYGVYRQTNNGHPPAQFAWDGLGGDTYWLWWHQVEILPPISFDNEDDGQSRCELNFTRTELVNSILYICCGTVTRTILIWELFF